MTTPSPWQERRARTAAELDRLGVDWAIDYGFYTVTTPDGEVHESLTISQVEWYCRGLDSRR